MERQLRERLPGGKFGYVAPRHSRLMKQVRGKGNRTTERRFRAALAAAGISGWHTNVREIKGSPDFYFPEERLAVFIDGCFWHGCKLCGHIPQKNRPFWEAKINRNREPNPWQTRRRPPTTRPVAGETTPASALDVPRGRYPRPPRRDPGHHGL
ncbi:MAG: hypothetical protein GXP31_18555 [Kiritimatiellaeota bacterium]|nr:hypothetical protein [Kiritimatiellota bacterium]